MSKCLALTREGHIVICGDSSDCNHIEHQLSNESFEDFYLRVEKTMEECAARKNNEERTSASECGIASPALIDDEDCDIRAAFARQSYVLDRLINSEYLEARYAVAQQGYGLDKLIDDYDWEVRLAVAENGYGLDKLVNDSAIEVRRAVAEQGYGLDKLVNDKSYDVRIAVAKQGYGLDKLIDDESLSVLCVVKYYLDKHHLTIEEYNQKVKETGGYDWVKEFNNSGS